MSYRTTRRRGAPARALLATLVVSLAMSFVPLTPQAATAAPVCTKTWLGGNGSWENPAAWVPNGVPTIADDVCITAPGDYTVIFKGDASGHGYTKSLQVGGAVGGTQQLTIEAETTVVGGGSQLSISSSLDISPSGVVNLTSVGMPGVAALGGNSSVPFTNAGTINLQPGSGGRRVLSGNIVNSGVITVDASASVNGNLTNGGLVSLGVGDVLKLGFRGEGKRYTQTASGTFRTIIAGTASGRLEVDHITLAGTIAADTIGTPGTTSYTPIGFATRSGEFTRTQFGGGTRYSVSYNPTVVRLTVAAADTSPPRVACQPADGLWHGDNVAIPCTASDAGSGLAEPTDASFDLVTALPAGQESADVPTNSRQVCDGAGNCTTAGPVTGNMIDRKAPTVTITTPADGATYPQGSTVTADYTCTDGGAGLASCDGTVPDGSPIDTSTPGTYTFTVEAADDVGNSSDPAASTYTVASGVPVATDDAPAPSPGWAATAGGRTRRHGRRAACPPPPTTSASPPPATTRSPKTMSNPYYVASLQVGGATGTQQLTIGAKAPDQGSAIIATGDVEISPHGVVTLTKLEDLPFYNTQLGSNSGLITNAGVINVPSSTRGGNHTVTGDLANRGEINIAASASLGFYDRTVRNTGTITVTGGANLSVGPGPNATLVNDGGTIDMVDGYLDLSEVDVFNEFGGTLNLDAGYLGPTSYLVNNGGLINLTDELFVDGQVINSGNINGTGAGHVYQYSGEFTQGNGTVTGNPVRLERADLSFTGTGSGTFEFIYYGRGSNELKGTSVPGQTVVVHPIITEDDVGLYYEDGFTNGGTITIPSDGGAGGVVDLRPSTPEARSTTPARLTSATPTRLRDTIANTGSIFVFAEEPVHVEHAAHDGNPAVFTNAGVLSLGAEDSMTIGGTYMQTADGTYRTTVAGSSVGSLSVDQATLAGTLAADTIAPPTLTDYYPPALGTDREVHRHRVHRRDLPGDLQPQSVQLTVGDTTPPAVSCGAPDGQWHGDNVAIACTASDDESGLADPETPRSTWSPACPLGGVDPTWPPTPRQVCDGAGNCATAGPITGNMIDRKAPTVTITTPADAPPTPRAHRSSPTTCTDGGSGVGTCDGPVPDGSPIDTSSPGTYTFTVDAADGVGNSGEPAASTYTVAPGVPVASDGAYTVDEGTSLTVPAPGVLGNDTDPDGDPLTAVLVAGPSSGTLRLDRTAASPTPPIRGSWGPTRSPTRPATARRPRSRRW